MVKVPYFAVEQWMDTYETTPGVLNISETCVDSTSLAGLEALSSPNTPPPLQDILSTKLTYGAIRGSQKLREHIAALYSGGEYAEPRTEARLPSVSPAPPPTTDQILVTQGAIAANFLALLTLVGPGDHVVCVYPTYQQLYSVPEMLGAEVSLWKLKRENGFVPDVEELKGLVKDNTKMLIINNPNNPTGVRIPTTVLTQIVSFAKEHNLLLFSDEVYRPLFHSSSDNPPPSALSYDYDNIIVTASMSKAFSLAGLRVGWIATRSASIIQRLAEARDHTTISVSGIDDALAAYALSDAVRTPLLQRNNSLAHDNLTLLAGLVARYPDVLSWTHPDSGTTAFVQFRKRARDGTWQPVEDDAGLCIDILEKTKVMLVPGNKCFGQGVDFPGYVRIGYACDQDVLVEALERLDGYIAKEIVGGP